MTDPAVIIGAGFIGQATARAIAATGRPVVLIARRPTAPVPGVETILIDLTDAVERDIDAVAAVLGPGSDVVFAAGTSVPGQDERHPQRSADPLRPLIAALEAVRRTPHASVLFISSGGAVYGEPDTLPIPEDHPLRPQSAYGTAKAAAEAYLTYYARRYGVAATALRLGNAYGPGQVVGRGQGLIGELIGAAVEGREVEIWGDGSVRRDFVHVDDIATAIAALAPRRGLPSALNVASGRSTSVTEAAELVSEVVGRPVRVARRPERPFDVHRIQLDITRLRDLIGFTPLSLAAGIRRSWAELAPPTGS